MSFACDQQTAQLFSYTRRRSSRCIYKRSYKNKREAIRNDQVTLAPLNLDLLLTHQRRVIARGKVFLRENDRGTRPSKRQLTMAALAPGRDYTPALTSQEPPAVVSRKAQLKIRLLAKNQEVRKKLLQKARWTENGVNAAATALPVFDNENVENISISSVKRIAQHTQRYIFLRPLTFA